MTTGMVAASHSTRSLRQESRWHLFVVLAANLIILSAAITYGRIYLDELRGLVGEWIVGWRPLGSIAAAAIIATVANGLLSSQVKFRLVFWRWHSPLPGSRAFSHHLRRDARIDFPALERELGPFPSEPEAQNALWYRIYQAVQNEPAIKSVHRDFLLTRDCAGLGMLLLIVLGGIALCTGARL